MIASLLMPLWNASEGQSSMPHSQSQQIPATEIQEIGTESFTDFTGQDDAARGNVPVSAGPTRPLALNRITDELLDDTLRVWSGAYGQTMTEDDGVEILLNVKRLAEVLMKSGQKGDMR